jgi:hypothetical protein
MLQVSYLDIAYVCNGFQVFFMCVFASVLEAYFKCFICLQTYVANVASTCFKSRSDVTHVAMRVRSGEDASGPARGLVARAALAPHGHVKPRCRRGRTGFVCVCVCV